MLVNRREIIQVTPRQIELVRPHGISIATTVPDRRLFVRTVALGTVGVTLVGLPSTEADGFAWLGPALGAAFRWAAKGFIMAVAAEAGKALFNRLVDSPSSLRVSSSSAGSVAYSAPDSEIYVPPRPNQSAHKMFGPEGILTADIPAEKGQCPSTCWGVRNGEIAYDQYDDAGPRWAKKNVNLAEMRTLQDERERRYYNCVPHPCGEREFVSRSDLAVFRRACRAYKEEKTGEEVDPETLMVLYKRPVRANGRSYLCFSFIVREGARGSEPDPRNDMGCFIDTVPA